MTAALQIEASSAPSWRLREPGLWWKAAQGGRTRTRHQLVEVRAFRYVARGRSQLSARRAVGSARRADAGRGSSASCGRPGGAGF